MQILLLGVQLVSAQENEWRSQIGCLHQPIAYLVVLCQSISASTAAFSFKDFIYTLYNKIYKCEHLLETIWNLLSLWGKIVSKN